MQWIRRNYLRCICCWQNVETRRREKRKKRTLKIESQTLTWEEAYTDTLTRLQSTSQQSRKEKCISYKDHVTNEEVHTKIQQAIRPPEDVLTIVKRHKLQWYGHIFRSSGLAKTIVQGTVKGGRRQGWQRKRLEDNIGEWTGLEEYTESQRAVENREKWRKLVMKSSVVPQRPLWVRGR